MFLDLHDVTQFKLGESVPSDGSEPLDESWEKETFEGKPAPQLHYARHDEGTVLHEHPPADWKRYRAFYRSRIAALDVGIGKVLDALQSTGLAERTAVVLRDLEGFSTAEVAEILESSEATVRSQISVARLKMRKAIARRKGGRDVLS